MEERMEEREEKDCKTTFAANWTRVEGEKETDIVGERKNVENNETKGSETRKTAKKKINNTFLESMRRYN